MSFIFSPIEARRLVFPAKQKVELEKFTIAELKEGEVVVRVEKSLMSTGTENIVFNRLFDSGTSWENWVKYPFYPGYAAVGRVEATGQGVTKVAVGDRVAVRLWHRSHIVCPEDECIPVPESVPVDEAIWFGLGKITFHGAKAARYQLGDSVLIIGAGPIGQMSTRWARAAGVARIIVVDSIAGRLMMAKEGGATATISLPVGEARAAILAANDGKLPRVVNDSTGNAAVFAAALGLTKTYGTVVIMGDTGSPANQRLTGDVINRGLHIVGAHDGHNSEEWGQRTITELFFSLVAGGRFSLSGLNTHHFRPEECVEAYGIANRDRASTMGIVFDWS